VELVVGGEAVLVEPPQPARANAAMRGRATTIHPTGRILGRRETF
jgi:hypothetical protein